MTAMADKADKADKAGKADTADKAGMGQHQMSAGRGNTSAGENNKKTPKR
jgi:hypothetical protein